MKIYKRDDKNSTTISLFDFIEVQYDKRNFNGFMLLNSCDYSFLMEHHVRGFYIQLFNIGLHIMFKSNKCME